MQWSRAFLTAVAFLVGFSGGSARAQQPAAPVAPAVLVQAAELRSFARQAEFVGRADALEKVDIRARVRGYLGLRPFQDGDPVKKDQVLFTIEKDPFEAAVDQKKAQLVSAQATLTNAEARASPSPVVSQDQWSAPYSRARLRARSMKLEMT